jgi:ABC-2 type transport system ATP-binding protein
VTEGSVDEIMRAVFTDAYLRVRLLDPADMDTASHLIAALPTCRQVEAIDASTLLAWFDGGSKDLVAILSQLSRSGVRVAEFALERPTLEDVFLHVTDMEAQA